VAVSIPYGPPGTSGSLDSAVAAEGALWVASDSGGRIVRVDPASGTVTARVDVPPRPGGLAPGGGAVWVFHFLHGAITRLDVATGTSTRLDVPGARATGIAYGGDSLWLLSTGPAELFELDPATGSIRRTISLRPAFAPTRSFLESWWLAFGDGAVWATLPNHDALARVDASTGEARYVGRSVVRLDASSGAVLGATGLQLADRTGFVSTAYGDGAAWLTNYDRNTLLRVTPASSGQVRSANPRRTPSTASSVDG
jgi:streptogramin lyase